MLKPSRRTQKVLAAATTPIAVLAAVAMVYRATDIAFSGQSRSFGDAPSSQSASAGSPTPGSPSPGSPSSGSSSPGSSSPGSPSPGSPSPGSPSPGSPSPGSPGTQPPGTQPPITELLSLTDDDRGASRFRVSNMVPGDTGTRCIKVTASANGPSTVKGYAVNPVFSAAGLEDHILITVEDGDGGSFEDCAGFVADNTLVPGVPLSTIASMDSYDAGMGGWSVSAGTSVRVYQLTWTFDTTGLTQAQVNKLQGTTAGIDMQWEMRSS